MKKRKNKTRDYFFASDLTRKYFWFIFTSACTLFILLLSTSYKHLSKLSIGNPYVYEYALYIPYLDTIRSQQKSRLDYLSFIKDSILFPEKLNRSFCFDIIFYYRKHNYEIQHASIYLDNCSRKISEMVASKSNTDRYIKSVSQLFIITEQIINTEQVLWTAIVDYSLFSLPDSLTKLKDLQKHLEHSNRILQLYNELNAKRSIYSTDLSQTILTSELRRGREIVFFWCATIFLVFITLNIGYLIVFILIPAGYEIWKEKGET